jgi:hypothetical protein
MIILSFGWRRGKKCTKIINSPFNPSLSGREKTPMMLTSA